MWRTVAILLALPLLPIFRARYITRLIRVRVPLLQPRLSEERGRAFDDEFGVDTSGSIQPKDLGVPEPDQSIVFESTDPVLFRAMITGLHLRYQEFTFIDLGSGKGRALLMASRFPFKRIIGVEWSEQLHRTALQNVRIYRGPKQCAMVESVHMDVREFPIPPEPSVFFLFHPFKEQVMAEVLGNIRASLESRPRKVVIVYYNPRLGKLLDAAGFLVRVAHKGWYSVYRGNLSGLDEVAS